MAPSGGIWGKGINLNRQLTRQETVLIQAVREWNMLGVRPMYADITKRIDGRIKVTEANKKRLAFLVREGYLNLYGKRYVDPTLEEPKENKSGNVVFKEEEILQHAADCPLLEFILSVRVHHKGALKALVVDFNEYGLNEYTLRRLELMVAALKAFMTNPLDVPELTIKNTDFKGTDMGWYIKRLIEVADVGKD